MFFHLLHAPKTIALQVYAISSDIMLAAMIACFDMTCYRGEVPCSFK
jgi:hypothetical protein